MIFHDSNFKSLKWPETMEHFLLSIVFFLTIRLLKYVQRCSPLHNPALYKIIIVNLYRRCVTVLEKCATCIIMTKLTPVTPHFSLTA